MNDLVAVSRQWLLLTVFLGFSAVASAQTTIDFDSDPVGSLPAGWKSAMTHAGGAPRWEVLKDDSAPSKPNVLAQLSSDDTSARFPLAIYEAANFTNGEVGVRFKPVAGQEDQAGGLVWRYRDENNYYLTRANAREDNVVLYKVQNGRRSSIAPKGMPPRTYGVKQKVSSGVWHTLRIAFQKARFNVYFDGKKLFDVEDAPFSEAG